MRERGRRRGCSDGAHADSDGFKAPETTDQRRSLRLGRGSASRSPRRRHDVRISRLGRGLLDPRIHLFRMDDAVRPAQFLLKLWAGARGVTSPGPELGAWANAGAARNATPATNRQSRETIAVMAVKRVHGRSVPWAEADIPCCFDRFTPAQTIRSMNRALRNSCGTSIIVRRLGRAPAHDEERHRGKGATRAVHRENMFDHGNSPHPPHPSPVIAGCRFDA